MSTAPDVPPPRGPYVTRDVCEAVHQEQREANHRTWEELRTLRRLVILLVVGGQLFTGGLNLAGLGYWLEEHAAHPHPQTVEMIASARTEAREDIREIRREVHDVTSPLAQRLARLEASRTAPPDRGDEP